MRDDYDGLIVDMDGTIPDTEPAQRGSWRQVPAQYGLFLDETAVIGMNGSPARCIAQASAVALLQHPALHNHVVAAVAADDVKRHTPEPDRLLRCADFMGLPARRCVLFADAGFDPQAARAAGVDTLDVR